MPAHRYVPVQADPSAPSVIAIHGMIAAELGAHLRCDQCPVRPAPVTIEPWSLSHAGVMDRGAAGAPTLD